MRRSASQMLQASTNLLALVIQISIAIKNGSFFDSYQGIWYQFDADLLFFRQTYIAIFFVAFGASCKEDIRWASFWFLISLSIQLLTSWMN